MRVAVTGATGSIGTRLVRSLSERGDSVVVLSRERARAAAAFGAGVEVHEWSEPTRQPAPADALAGVDAVVHLLGEPVAQRWSPAARAGIRDSRVLGTRNLVAALRGLAEADRPRVLVSGSATGIYGPRADEPLDESAPAGTDFLADVVVAWEAEAQAATDLLRVVSTRTGVVLAPHGGALEKMLPIFGLGLGGPVGGGAQYVSWIHIDDAVRAILAGVDDARLHGPVNLTAPAPVTNRELSLALGRALHRPAFWPVPASALKLLYGSMSTVLLTGQRAVPRVLTDAGFTFDHPELDGALRAVVAQR